MRLEVVVCAFLALVAVAAFVPLVQYPFAFHDDLVVPYWSHCSSVIPTMTRMGRPGQGLVYCLNANVFPGIERTHLVRLVSLAVVACSAGGLALFAVREGLRPVNALTMSLLAFLSVSSVLLVYYVASAGQVYGNLLAVVAALTAQRFVNARDAGDDSATSTAMAAVLLGTAAYGFYQASGVLYFAVVAVAPLLAVEQGQLRRAVSRVMAYGVVGSIALLAYGALFWTVGGRLQWSDRRFGFAHWFETFRLDELWQAWLEPPWGALYRVFAPWTIIGGPVEVPYGLFGVLFVCANLGIARAILACGDTGRLARVAAVAGWGVFVLAIGATLYSPLVFSGTLARTYRALFPAQLFVVVLGVVGIGMTLRAAPWRTACWWLWRAAVPVAALSTALYAAETLAGPARAELDYVVESMRASRAAGAQRLPVHILVPALASPHRHDEYGHLSSYYTNWGNEDAKVLVNLARDRLGMPLLPTSMFSFSVGSRAAPPGQPAWVIDLYPLAESGMYFKHKVFRK